MAAICLGLNVLNSYLSTMKKYLKLKFEVIVYISYITKPVKYVLTLWKHKLSLSNYSYQNTTKPIHYCLDMFSILYYIQTHHL